MLEQKNNSKTKPLLQKNGRPSLEDSACRNKGITDGETLARKLFCGLLCTTVNVVSHRIATMINPTQK